MVRTIVLILTLLIIGCGSKDPLADIKKGYPGASEYLVWKNYLLIRYPFDSTAGAQRAVILQKVGNNWTHLAQSEQGFNSLREVVTYIPEIDESGVAAFKLR
ncbi:MAG: hypothetical protein K6T77_00595 [candidate division WOR-3 bacterium]|nr:hypothetical protein [candidate division WOR-3 bacterium]